MMETLENNVYRIMDDADKVNIQKRAQEMSALLNIWASCYPVIRTRRTAAVSVMVCTVLPDLSMPFALLVGKMILFAHAVNDLVNERILPYTDFLRAGEGWDQIARGLQDNQPEPGDDLGIVLSGIRAELTELPMFPVLRDLWGRRLWALLLALAQEYLDGLNNKVRGDDSLPKLDEYLMGGIHSSGFPLWGTAIVILLNDQDLLGHMDVVNEVILQTGAAICMYNDVRSYDQEAPDNNINAVAIVHHDLINSSINRSSPERLMHSKEIVLHLADQYTQKVLSMVENPITQSGRFEQMIRRVLAFHSNTFGMIRHNRRYSVGTPANAFTPIHGR